MGRNNLSNIRNSSIRPLRHHTAESLLSPCAVAAVRFMLFTLITFWMYIRQPHVRGLSRVGGTSSHYPTCNRHYSVGFVTTRARVKYCVSTIIHLATSQVNSDISEGSYVVFNYCGLYFNLTFKYEFIIKSGNDL